MERLTMIIGGTPNPAGSVVLERMPQQAEVRSAGDDWTGRTDAAERRKRQNRLHQRLYRKLSQKDVSTACSHQSHPYHRLASLVWLRYTAKDHTGKRQKELKTKQYSSPESTTEEAQPVHGLSDPHLKSLLDARQPGKQLDILTRVRSQDYEYKKRLLEPSMTRSQVQDVIEEVENFVALQRRTSVPRADLLLTLVQFNVFRALYSNMVALDFTLDWLTGDAISPFYQNTAPIHDLTSPCSLRSSALQRSVSHHPYIDLFPFPSLRDNILLQGEDFDDNDLCYDMVEICHAPRERSGLIVWSSPWEPSSWEVTPEFASKFPWVLRGCRELLISTNYWRGSRGEEDLHFDVTPLDLPDP